MSHVTQQIIYIYMHALMKQKQTKNRLEIILREEHGNLEVS